MNDLNIELIAFEDIKESRPIRDKNGKIIGEKKVVIKKDMERKINLFRSECTVHEFIDAKGKLKKDRCLIYSAESKEYFLVKGSYKNLYQEIHQPPIVIKGFKK